MKLKHLTPMNKGCATFAASNGYAKENVDGKAAPRVDNKATQIRKRNLPRVKHSEKITLKKLLKKFLFFCLFVSSSGKEIKFSSIFNRL